jgi:hypothetical protein
MKSEVSLMVNGQPISLDGFVKELIDSTVGGMLLALEGVNEINDIDLQINGGEVSVAVNGAEVPINSFASNTIKNTVIGMISSFKGVSQVNTARILIKR